MNSLPRAYNELVSLLLSEEDRTKFEWAIGAILSGGPANIVIVHGRNGSGKSTLLNIVRKVLMAPLKANYAPRVSLQHDGYIEMDQDTYVFAAENNPDNGFVDGAVHIFTTGDRVSVNKHYVLMNQVSTEAIDIAELCINAYRNNDFQENNR